MYQIYTQLKNRITDNFEINSGVHLMFLSVNGDLSIEPRVGFRWQFAPGKFLNSGAGFHSRMEAFPVYYNLIKNIYGNPEPLNKDLNLSKSFQIVSGLDMSITKDIRFRFEVYNQHLFDVPIIEKANSTYSSLNASESLPMSDLTNKGVGYNRGIELTLEKSFSRNYYFLYTLSVYKSKYKPGDGNWYNTYYNTSFVSNFLAGKDFFFGNNKRNCVGLNSKVLFRGGYRYTPVDLTKSLSLKKVIYATAKTYTSQLPDFLRIDAGINFRRNNLGFSWILMLDIQNVFDRKNVFRKKFSYEKNRIVTYDILSMGIVPVLNFRVEF
jgi:hypothetical protein